MENEKSKKKIVKMLPNSKLPMESQIKAIEIVADMLKKRNEEYLEEILRKEDEIQLQNEIYVLVEKYGLGKIRQQIDLYSEQKKKNRP